MPPTYPDGLDVECFTMGALETAWREARLQSEREHVTPFIRNGSAGLRTRGWTAVADLSALRWTVDHPDDLQHVAALVAACADRRRIDTPAGFDRFDLLRILETQPVGPAGAHPRNEGYVKSLAADM